MFEYIRSIKLDSRKTISASIAPDEGSARYTINGKRMNLNSDVVLKKYLGYLFGMGNFPSEYVIREEVNEEMVNELLKKFEKKAKISQKTPCSRDYEVGVREFEAPLKDLLEIMRRAANRGWYESFNVYMAKEKLRKRKRRKLSEEDKIGCKVPLKMDVSVVTPIKPSHFNGPWH